MTKIEWSEATWNPTVGCSIVSPGCTNCYAMRMAARLESMSVANEARTGGDPGPLFYYRGLTQESRAGWVWTGKVKLAPEDVLTKPLRWRKPRMIFVNSMSDLFHEDVPDGWIMTVFDIMWRTPWHTYQILTKRSKRMREFIAKWCDLSGENFGEFKDARGPDAVRKAHPSGRGQLFAAYLDTLLQRSGGEVPDGAAWPTFDWMEGMIGWPNVAPNVWLGVSCERQQEADERIPDLLATPAAVRFVSAEPLLGPVDFSDWLGDIPMHEEERVGWANEEPTPLRDHPWRARGIDWIIVGSESGRGARPCELDWVRSIRDQCNASAVPFFWKQHAVNGRKLPTPELDGKQWTEFPQTTDLRSAG